MSALKLCPTCSAEYPANERFCPRDGTALRAQGAGNDLVGSMIADRYHVIRKLGEGGMGQVYLVEHVKMGRKSALKVMNASMAQDAEAISRFNREASNASRINHPHVAGIYDFGETPDGVIYLAMEYVEGEPLSKVVSDAGALSPARAAEITRQTGEALAAAHEMGIVHRDLKPDNIMIARDREGADCVKVVDFGIAKAANVEAQKVTRTGLVIGTPEYMSPEQIAGDPLDGRSDIYSLGLVAFHMLTGGLPFPSETVQESMIMRLTDQPKRLAEMRPDVRWAPAVQTVMDRALQRDVKERYSSASEFGRALKAAVDAMPASGVVSGAQSAARVSGDGAVPATRLSEQGPPRASTAPARKWSMPMLIGAAGVAFAVVAVSVILMSSHVTSASAPPLVPPHSSPTSAPAAAPDAPDLEVATSQPSGNVPVATRTALHSPASATELTDGQAHGYRAELLALEHSMKDSASAIRVANSLPGWKSKVTLATDRAILQVVEAEVATLTEDSSEACSLWKRIKRDDVISELKNVYSESMKSCAAP